MIGALMLVLSGACAGEAAASSLTAKERQLAELELLLQKTEVYLSGELLGTNEIYERLASLDNSYSQAFRSDDPVDYLRHSELAGAAELAEYLKNFGHTDLQGQLAQNALLLAEISDKHSVALAKCSRQCKLRRVMGLSAGLIAAIILI